MDAHDDAISDGNTPSARGSMGGTRGAKSISHQTPMWLSEATPDEFAVRAVQTIHSH